MFTTARRLLIACAAAACAGLPAHASAHDPGLSSVSVIQRAATGALSLVIDDADLPEARRAGARACSGAGVLAVALDGRPLALELSCRARDAKHTEYTGTFTLPGAGRLTIELPLLAELPRGHRSFARALADGGKLLDQRLLQRGDRWQLTVKAPPRRRPEALALVGLSGLALAAVLLRAAARRRSRGARPRA